MAEAPSAEDMAPLLGESAALDMPAGDPYGDEDAEFMSAAISAVGTETAAQALKDAMEACLRSHGLIGGGAADEEAEPESEAGAGFPDL